VREPPLLPDCEVGRCKVPFGVVNSERGASAIRLGCRMPANGVAGTRPPVSGPREDALVARKSFNFEKRQRELSKERKKEEKRQRKLDRKNTGDDVPDGAPEDIATGETPPPDPRPR